MTIEEARGVHSLVIDGKWVDAGNSVLGLLGKPKTITTKPQALAICQNLFQHLLDNEMYLHAATLQWGSEVFQTEPEGVRRSFEALRTGSTVLFMGSSSSGKTYGAGGWMLLDYLRDPLYTTVKLAAVNEDHLRKNLFAHVATLYRSIAIPVRYDIQIRDSDLWMGVKDAGYEFGISGIAFKQSQETSGQFKGYKAKPVRAKPHPKFGYMSRLRVLGDECVRGDQMVWMADGTEKRIDELVKCKSTASVLSFNTESGEVESKPITGWHKVPLRGRKLLNIGGAIVTEDHPVFTDKWKFELANMAETCLKIGHEELLSLRKSYKGSGIHNYRGTSWRFVDLPKSRRKEKRARKVHAGGAAIRLPEMEASKSGQLHDRGDSWAVHDGVWWGYISIFNDQPSRIHKNSRDDGKGWNQEIFSRSSNGVNASCASGLVYGRREHISSERRNDANFDDSYVFFASVRRRRSSASTKIHGLGLQAEAEQGVLDNNFQCSGDPELAFIDSTICRSVSLLQDRREAGSYSDEGFSINEGTRHAAMRYLRDTIQEGSSGEDMHKGVQSEAFEDSGEQKVQEDKEFVYCIDVSGNHNFFVEGVLIHNCQNWPNGPFKDFNSLVASKSGTELIKLALAFNPESTSQTVVQMAEPEHGWNIEDLDTLYDYESKAGWKVCRLDAARCENVIQKKIVYPGLQTYEGFISYLKAGGDSSSNFFTFARGFPPMKGAVNTIIDPSWPQEARGEAVFVDNPIILGAVDLAFMGKDSAQMAVARWGLASSWRDHTGKVEVFKDRLNIAINKPRHVLQIDQILPLQKHSDTIKMAEEIIGRCKMLRITPRWLALDKTSIGLGTYSHLSAVWGECFGVSWNEKATEMKILAEDFDGADKQVDGVMSEMWWAFRRWLEPRCRAIIINPIIPPQPIHTQLTSRRYSTGKKGVKVESKDVYKARNQNSPDEADALVMLVHLVRKNSTILPGLVEETKPSMQSSDIKFESLKSMKPIESSGDSMQDDGVGEERDRIET